MFRCSKCGALNRIPAQHAAGAPVCGRCQAGLDVSGVPQPVNADEYRRAIVSAPLPVLVDFWAPWCGPCRAVAPVLEGLGRAKAGKLLVLKVNTDEHPELSQGLGIRGIPTLVLFNQGAEVARQAGALPAHQMERWVSQHAGV